MSIQFLVLIDTLSKPDLFFATSALDTELHRVLEWKLLQHLRGVPCGSFLYVANTHFFLTRCTHKVFVEDKTTFWRKLVTFHQRSRKCMKTGLVAKVSPCGASS